MTGSSRSRHLGRRASCSPSYLSIHMSFPPLFRTATLLGDNIPIHQEDYDSLTDGQKITDNVINSLICGVFPRFGNYNRKLLPVISHFLDLLAAQQSLDYFTRFQREFDCIEGVNIFDFDDLLIPLHISGHWVAVVVSLKERNITSYD